uniref:HALZ domain-containing protein n=1 Tax=Mesocestoides corti TaxID=53468 RepID=A0A5K3F158_MESCO
MNTQDNTKALQAELEKKTEENANLKAELQEVLSRFKDLKIKAERRARLLHHVMSEYNAMTKEYDIMKVETTTLQSKSNEMYQHILSQDTKIEQLEQSIQVLEAENNELRQSRIIDASTKQWYGECTHSCSRHPRTYPNLSVHSHTGVKIPDEETCPPCETCTEAEAWAEGLINSPNKFSDSLRRHFQSTLPVRSRMPLPRQSYGTSTMTSTPASTLRFEEMKKPVAEVSQDEPSTPVKVN